jgi:hypothetical protein
MALVNTRAMRFRPRSLADTLDGNNSAAGACGSLVNLIQDPSTPACLQCRPAAQIRSTFPTFSDAGVISQAFQLNGLIFGMIGTDRFPGHDEPFCFNVETQAFLTVTGVTASNTPLTQPSTGDWTSPSMGAVGTRIIVCHPGFEGLGSNAFGYFDISNFSENVTINTVSGSNQLTGNASIGALSPGYTIVGAGIPAGASVVNTANATPQSTGFTNGGSCNVITTSGSAILTNVSTTAGFVVGQPISGTGILPSAVINSIGTNTITMSANATVNSPTATTSVTTASGSNSLTAVVSTVGFSINQPITGTGIPANTTITGVVSGIITMSANATAAATGVTVTTTILEVVTTEGTIITNVAAIAGFAVGQVISGLNIPNNTTITGISGSNITMSQAATAASGVNSITVSASGTVITMSANATATALNVSVVVAGGTTANPLWCAGTTTNVPLTGIPSVVGQFNNRPYFAVGPYLVFCDPLTLNISEATQVLLIGDTSPITALVPLTIINVATAAPLQGLLVFKQNLITIVTGDPTTDNFANNVLSASGIGTTSPDAVATTPVGVYFIDVDGLRCVELSGNITDPLPDVRVPFISALTRTRISGAYNAGIYRVCLQNGAVSGTPFQEFWFDLKYKLWTGPHSFRQDVCVPYEGSFVAFSNANPGILYQTDVVQTATSNFIENGNLLSWIYATSALPDEGDLMYNSLVVSSINVAFKDGAPTLQCVATDEDGTVQGLANILTPGAPSYWGSMIWGAAIWYGQQYGLRPHQIPWTAPVVFSKLILTITAQSSLGFQISNFQGLFQPLGYVSTPVGVAANSSPPPVPPPTYLWDQGYDWDSGINWQG